jgi:hypothetical protein
LSVVLASGQDEALCRELKIPEGFTPTSGLALGRAAAEPKARELTTTKIAVDYIR